MNKEISKNLVCVLMRGGIEIWVDVEKVDMIKMGMEQKRIFKIGNSIVNGVDIMGVFEAKTMEERNHRKNGDWQCQHGFWHEKFNQCGHRSSKG